MKKLSKKAFTLIEILGAITILGIISIVAIVSVSKIIERAKNEHYKTAEKNFTLAAQSFVQQNRNSLPKVIGQKKKVQLKVLLDNNYIEEILDYRKEDCDPNSSYVQVFKYSQTDYSYLPYLDCPNYDSKKMIDENYKATITITYSGTDVKDAKAKLVIEDDKKLLSYNYVVYKNGKEVKNVGNQEVKNYDTKVSKTIKLDDYTPGKIKIVVTSTNIYGVTTTFTGSHEYKDTTDPICIIKEEDKEKNPKPWITSGTRKITVGCDDGKGVGCTRKTYSKTFKTDTKIGTITIKDEAGNKRDCKVSVYIDKTAPTIYDITNDSNSKWTNKNVKISAKAKDNTDGSEVKMIAYYYDKDETRRTDWSKDSTTTKVSGVWSAERDNIVYLVAEDNAGNTSTSVSAGSVKIDKTAPTISWDTSEGPHENSSGITVYTSCTDSGGSGVKTHTRSSSVSSPTTGTSKTHYCTDNAGNSVDTSRTFSVKTYSRNSICGIEKYNSCPNSSCSCATYQCTLYKKCRDEDCGVESYNSCRHSDCGSCETWGRCSVEGCEKFTSWKCEDWANSGIYDKNCPSCCPGGNESVNGTWTNKKSDYERKQYKNCTLTTGGGQTIATYKSRKCTRDCETYNRGSKCYCETYPECATKACGVKSYKLCRDSSCGTETVTGSECNNANSKTCKTYNSCEHEVCGVASYNPCWHY